MLPGGLRMLRHCRLEPPCGRGCSAGFRQLGCAADCGPLNKAAMTLADGWVSSTHITLRRAGRSERDGQGDRHHARQSLQRIADLRECRINEIKEPWLNVLARHRYLHSPQEWSESNQS